MEITIKKSIDDVWNLFKGDVIDTLQRLKKYPQLDVEVIDNDEDYVAMHLKVGDLSIWIRFSKDKHKYKSISYGLQYAPYENFEEGLSKIFEFIDLHYQNKELFEKLIKTESHRVLCECKSEDDQF